MDRTKFFEKVINSETGVDELDYLSASFDKFVLNYTPAQYRLTVGDIMRPDLVSYKNYQTVNYWWVLCLHNGCNNVLTDMNVGDVWQVPNISDIYLFIKKYRVR